jgi:hypothetical protein
MIASFMPNGLRPVSSFFQGGEYEYYFTFDIQIRRHSFDFVTNPIQQVILFQLTLYYSMEEGTAEK